MKTKIIAAGWLLLGMLYPFFARAEAKTIEMIVGEQRVLDVHNVTKVTQVDAKVADVKIVGEGKMILYGVAKGRTSLVVFFKAGRLPETWNVVVRDKKVEEFKINCAELLGAPCTDLEVSTIGDKVVLHGKIRDIETYHKVRRIKQGFPEVVLQVDIEPRILDALVTVINEELKRAGLKGAYVWRSGSKLILDGNVADDYEIRKAKIIVDGIYDSALGSD